MKKANFLFFILLFGTASPVGAAIYTCDPSALTYEPNKCGNDVFAAAGEMDNVASSDSLKEVKLISPLDKKPKKNNLVASKKAQINSVTAQLKKIDEKPKKIIVAQRRHDNAIKERRALSRTDSMMSKVETGFPTRKHDRVTTSKTGQAIALDAEKRLSKKK